MRAEGQEKEEEGELLGHWTRYRIGGLSITPCNLRCSGDSVSGCTPLHVSATSRKRGKPGRCRRPLSLRCIGDDWQHEQDCPISLMINSVLPVSLLFLLLLSPPRA
jgi:hypothetical protein